MTKTVSIVAVSFFVSGLVIAPFAMATPAQQHKMKSCNKEAGEKNLKGDERKKFMSTCLSA